MTLRELLKSLQGVDEKSLDMDVMVIQHSGGYEGISYVYVFYVGHPVLHLAEPKPVEPPPNLWVGSTEGNSVATVSPDDLRKVWAIFPAGGEHSSIDIRSFQHVCSPGADVMAVWFRASMLAMMTKMMPELLARWTHDGEFDDAVFQVAATFPMEKMKTGVVRQGPPLDVEEFVRQIGART